MLDFQPLTLEQIHGVRADFSRPVPRTCDYTVGGLLLWRDYFDLSYAAVGSSMIYRLRLPDGTVAHQVPADPDPALLHAIAGTCAAQELPCRFAFVSSEGLEQLQRTFSADRLIVTPQREWFDYLYEKDAMITYAGKKLRGQRNHVNKFRAAYPRWRFLRADASHLPLLREFYEIFWRENRKSAPTWLEEERKIPEWLDHFEEYGFLCGILTVDGTVAGFSVGERSGDTLVIHTEKADRRFHGSYPMLAARFVEAFAGDDPTLRYVNREDDSGDEGLRTAKMSYHPCALLEKYLVELLPERRLIV